MQDALKKMVRKHHNDMGTASTTWESTIAHTGVVGNRHFKDVIDNLSIVFSWETADLARLATAMTFITTEKASDSFLKNITVVASEIMKSAAQRLRGLKSEEAHETASTSTHGQLLCLLDKIPEEPSAPKHLNKFQELLNVLAHDSSSKATSASQHSQMEPSWRACVEVVDCLVEHKFKPIFIQLLPEVRTGLQLAAGRKEFGLLMDEKSLHSFAGLLQSESELTDLTEVYDSRVRTAANERNQKRAGAAMVREAEGLGMYRGLLQSCLHHGDGCKCHAGDRQNR